MRREIAELTELYGLDLRHRTIVPGEIQARKTVGQRQIELAENLEELQEAMSSAGSVEIVCPVCLGTGMTSSTHEESVLANTGDQHELLTPWH